MKNKLWLETARTIKKSIGKYIMLVLIVFMGVSFFSGMLSISVAMGESVDRYTDEYGFFDFQIYSNYGFDEDDIDALNESNENIIAEGGYFVDAEGSFGDTNYIFRLESYDEANSVNKLKLVDGRYPENANEALAEIPSDLYETPKIGDVININRATMELDEVLNETEFTVVGIVTTPNYMSQEKGVATLDNLTLNTFLYLPKEAFSGDVYSTVYLKNTELTELNSFSVAYEEKVLKEEEALLQFTDAQETVRAEQIKSDALEEYEDGVKEYADGLKEFEDEITNAQNDINAGYDEIIKNEEDVSESIKELNSVNVQLDALISSGMADAQIMAAKGQAAAELSALESVQTELIKAKEELDLAQEELDKQRIEGEEELNEASLELDDAKKEIDKLEDGEWTVLTREMHYSMATYSDTVSQMQVVGLIFPVFFFLVAALVCLTTMTRMIDEQRTQIGILRALGYSRFACASKYLMYALSATFLGGVLGAVIGVLVFPQIVYNTWNIVYNLPKINYTLPWVNMVIAVVIFMMVMSLVTFSAIRIETAQVAGSLMRPKAPPAGKKVFVEKIPFLWKRFSFNAKVTSRNIIRYKKRFFMTVTGIAGCTCLLVSGFGMRDSISEIAHLQYDMLTLYDGVVSAEEDTTKDEFDTMLASVRDLDDNIIAIPFASYASELSYEENEAVGYVQVYENDEQLKELNVVRQRTNRESYSLDGNGILISEKLSEILGVGIGDDVTIESQNEEIAMAKVSGIYEKYINHEIYISEQYYQALFSENVSENAIQVKSEMDEKTLQEEILVIDNVSGIIFNSSMVSSFGNITGSMDIVVIVIIVSAAALAFVVLGNLASINISERKREIATLKVLGFYHRETKDYIFNENMVLTIFGALFGTFLGIYSHRFIITQVEMDFIMFIRTVSVESIIYSVILTFVFSAAVNRFMLSRLKNINMIESLKSVE